MRLREHRLAAVGTLASRFSLTPGHSAAKVPHTLSPHAGAYSFNVSVQGGSWCIASFTVTPCPPATLTCTPARVVALTQATSCSNVVLPVSSFYNVTPPGDIPALVIVDPPLPSALTFGPGEPGSAVCLVQLSRPRRPPARLWAAECHIAARCPHCASPLHHQSACRTPPPSPPPLARRSLHVHRVGPGRQLVQHVAQRDGVPCRDGGVRPGEGGGPDVRHLVRQCSPAAVVLLQHHSAGGYPSYRDSRPTAAARVDFWGG